jgi:putative hydrolase of the HAD superfamily
MESLLTNLKDKSTYIFDFFHTLTDFESNWGNFPWTSDYLGISKEAWGEQLQNNSEDRLRGRIKDSYEIVKRLAHNIDPSIPNDKIKDVAVFRIKRCENAVLNIPENVIRTLSILKSQGKKIGLITNADATELLAWDRCPIVRYIDCSIHSYKVGLIKPERAIYELCLKTLGSSVSESVFIGDGGSNELIGAKECGLTTVIVTGIIREFWADKIESRTKFADYQIEFVDELLQ